LCYNYYMLVDANGQPYNLEAIALADRLIKAKHKYQKDSSSESQSFWKVIDEVLEVWKETRPDEWESTIVDIRDARRSTYNKFGASEKSSLRRTLDVPLFFERAVRYLYSVEELPFNKEWYHELWKRYPEFRVSEKS